MMEDYKVITPENVELDYRIADVGSRFLALFIDTLIQCLIMIGIGFLFAKLDVEELNLDSQMAGLSEGIIIAILIALPFVFHFLYFIILEMVLNGQTLGKRLLNIRVRKEGGYPPGFWDILLRNLLRTVDLLPIFYGIGVISMFFNKKAKRLGDFAAGTIVVKELSRRRLRRFLQDEPSMVDAPVTDQSWNTASAAHGLSTILPYIGREDYYLLKDLVSRRKKLANYDTLADQVIQSLLTKAPGVKLEDTAWQDAGAVLESLIVLYEQSRGNG